MNLSEQYALRCTIDWLETDSHAAPKDLKAQIREAMRCLQRLLIEHQALKDEHQALKDVIVAIAADRSALGKIAPATIAAQGEESA